MFFLHGSPFIAGSCDTPEGSGGEMKPKVEILDFRSNAVVFVSALFVKL